MNILPFVAFAPLLARLFLLPPNDLHLCSQLVSFLIPVALAAGGTALVLLTNWVLSSCGDRKQNP